MPESESRRRSFLKTAATGILILKPATVFGSQANSNVEVGLIGCGGRGNWITTFFPEHTGARVVALADVVKDHLDGTATTFKVPASRAYYGPDAGRQLAQSAMDAVIIETPTYYNAEQASFAVDAGKHVYMAKPVAVDVPQQRTGATWTPMDRVAVHGSRTSCATAGAVHAAPGHL